MRGMKLKRKKRPELPNNKNLIGFRARIINPKSINRVVDFKDGLLVTDRHGKIISCDNYTDSKDKRGCSQIHDFSGSLIIPGLVDCHTHLPQLDCRGKHGATLLDWLERYIYPAEKSFKDPRIVRDVGRRFFKKLILNGTTTSAIYVTVHHKATDMIFELAKTFGVRAVIGKVMMDQNSPRGLLEKTNVSLRQSEDLAAKWHGAEGGRLRYAFTPRFAPTCSKELLKGIGVLVSGTDAYIQSHIAETPGFPDPFSVFERTGCAGGRTILGHAIYLGDSEYRRMTKSRTKIAHCPTSNFFLKSGSLPLSRVEKAGVTYGLGTDIGAGTSMSIFTEMRHADYTQLKKAVTPAKAFYLATMGGAEVLSMEKEIGSLDPGKFADFLVLDNKKIDYRYQLSKFTTDEILSLLMYRGDSRVVRSTYVAGKKLDVDAVLS